jgi:hypothetical protein
VHLARPSGPATYGRGLQQRAAQQRAEQQLLLPLTVDRTIRLDRQIAPTAGYLRDAPTLDPDLRWRFIGD